MRPRITALAVGVVAALALAAAPASAAGGAVRITLDVNFATGVEEFTATGAFCPAGEAESFDTWVTGRGANVFHLTKVFTCSDGTGTLEIRLDAPFIGALDGTTGGWRVIGGTHRRLRRGQGRRSPRGRRQPDRDRRHVRGRRAPLALPVPVPWAPASPGAQVKPARPAPALPPATSGRSHAQVAHCAHGAASPTGSSSSMTSRPSWSSSPATWRARAGSSRAPATASPPSRPPSASIPTSSSWT